MDFVDAVVVVIIFVVGIFGVETEECNFVMKRKWRCVSTPRGLLRHSVFT